MSYPGFLAFASSYQIYKPEAKVYYNMREREIKLTYLVNPKVHTCSNQPLQ